MLSLYRGYCRRKARRDLGREEEGSVAAKGVGDAARRFLPEGRDEKGMSGKMVRLALWAGLMMAFVRCSGVQVFGCSGPEHPNTRTPEHPASVVVTPKVLVINYDPVIPGEGGKRLHEAGNWRDPRTLADAYTADLKECSGGYA